MTGSRRGKLAALVLFGLLVAVVLGVISWATRATLELAKRNVLDEHDRQVDEALLRMDGYLNGIINAETAREYVQYRSLYMVEAVTVVSRDAIERDADVLLPSPLARSIPQHDWMDLYFQVDTEGMASSPQVPLEGAWLSPERIRLIAGCDPRVCRTWHWLTTRALPSVDLGAMVAQALPADDRLGSEDRGPQDSALSVNTRPADMNGHQTSATLRRQLDDLNSSRSNHRKRQQSYMVSRSTYIPPWECVAPHIADRNIRAGGEAAGGWSESPARPADVEVKTGKFAEPFWLEPQAEEGPKLAFVRQCFRDETIFHQGFIGDWNRLKETLLDEIGYLYTGAELEPITDDAKVEAKLAHLPARLIVPEVPGAVAMAAWRSVRGTLIATWAAAAAVLIVAGLGLRNLVSLTERRMQFAYAVTHELRTPLTTFRLYSDLLAGGMVPEESKPDYLNTLNREAERLSTLVEDVLEYARVENQRIRLNVVETDGPSLMQSLADSHARRCSENGIEPKLENAIVNGHVIETDVDVVNRIAGILVNNACRHARGRDSAAIVMRLGADNGHVHLDVIDNGPGIDRGDARNIFKPFRRGKRADAAAQGGIGLGLSLARNWAKLLGGRLDLVARHDSQYGGAHFRLTIPSRAIP